MTLKITIGNKRYELKKHLGKVMATITDRKQSVHVLSETVIGSVLGLPLGNPVGLVLPNLSHYQPEVVSISDYYPFGMQLPGRQFSSNSYRYGFNGVERDDEMKGAGNSLNYKFRMYVTRLSRFFAVDPISAQYPMLTPYQHSSLNPIMNIELEGLEGYQCHQKDNSGKVTKITVVIDLYVAVSSNENYKGFRPGQGNVIRNELNSEYSKQSFSSTKYNAPVEFQFNVSEIDALEKDNIKAEILSPKNWMAGTDSESGSITPILSGVVVSGEKMTENGITSLGEIKLNRKGTSSHTKAHEMGHSLLKYKGKFEAGRSPEKHAELDGIFYYPTISGATGRPVEGDSYRDLNQKNVDDFIESLPIQE